MDAIKDRNLTLVAKTRASVMGQISLGLISIFTAWTIPQTRWSIFVFLFIILVNVGRLALQKIHNVQGRDENQTWYMAFAFLTLLTSFSWGAVCAGLVLLYGKMHELSLLVMIIIAGLASGATSTLTPDKSLARAFIIFIIGPPIFAFAYLGDFSYAAIAAVTLMYTIFLLMQINIHSDLMAELQARRSQVRAFEDATLETIIVHREGKIVEVNASFQRMFQYTKEEVLGRSLFDLTPPALAPSYVELGFQDDMKPVELKGQRKDGSIFDIEVVGRWFTYDDQKVRVTCILDITARKAAEAVTREREMIAIESARAKSQFLANMSHEIRTPLNAIIGITDLLTNTASSELQKKYFRTLKDSGEALLGLVNDILDFSKIEEKKLELEIIEFSLPSAVEGQVDLMANRARQKGLSLQVFLDPHLPLRVSGDYGRLGQVILNLVSNALKFTEEGSVRVSAKVKAYDGKSVVIRFEVSDTGAGIAPEAANRLFRPFTQADSSTARKHGGTGLGLSISQKIVELMGGQIGFTSEVGKGTTFWFEVPLPVIEAEPLADFYNRRPTEKKSVIVVKEALPILDVLEAYLDSWGVPVEIKSITEMDGHQNETIILSSGPVLEMMFEIIQKQNLKGLELVVVESTADSLFYENKNVKTSLPQPVRYSDLYNAINKNTVEDLKAEVQLEDGAANFENYRILIAEDNTTNQLIITAFLRHYGLSYHTVSNGIEAIDAFAEGGFDLVLMDCQMPEMDGFEATEKIRKLEESMGTHIPIVALTANALKEDKDRCLACGMDDFLTKPIRKEKLLLTLQRFLASKTLSAENI